MFPVGSVPSEGSGETKLPDPVASTWGHDYAFDPGPLNPMSAAKIDGVSNALRSGEKRQKVRGREVGAGNQRSGSSVARRKSLGQKSRTLKKQRNSSGLNMSYGSAVEVHSSRQPYTQYPDQYIHQAPVKRRRTTEDFLMFCGMVLDYERSLQEEANRQRHSSSPMGSTGSSAGSWTSGSAGGAMGVPKDELFDEQVVPSAGRRGTTSTNKDDVTDGDGGETDDGWDQITCFCNKPYAGLPMVECTSCFTWLHQKCARLKRNRKIPDDWRCFRCVEKKPKVKSESSPKSASRSPKITGSRKRKSSISRRRQMDPTADESETLVDQPGGPSSETGSWD